MQVVAAVGFVIGGLLYLAYIGCAVPIAAVSAFVVYGAGMPAAYLYGLGQVLAFRSALRSGPSRPLKLPDNPDPAIPQYFYGPAVVDADHAVRVARGNCRWLWQQGTAAVRSSFGAGRAVATWPLGFGGAIGMTVGAVAGIVVTAGCAVIHLAVVGVSAAFVRAAGTVLRGADSAVLRVKNIRMVCPNPACYRRVPYPGYECPSPDCPNRHRDVRPGRFGVLRRRCRCGTRMNTLLLFGSSRMSAFCPYCGHSLEHHPGRAPEIVLPFFGAAGAGKTRLLFSMVLQLRMWSEQERPEQEQARAGRFAVEFGNADTTRRLGNADRVLGPESATLKTPVELPPAYVICLTSRHSTRILHMFDAAGEYFYRSERTQELGYLDKAGTFILVIDPLSIEAFWDRLPPDQQAKLKDVRSAAPSPDLAYQQAHQQMEEMGVNLNKARLAVAFSRADLIDAPGDDVAAWARDELGLGNLVRSAQLNFREVRFFHTAAVMNTDGGIHASIRALLRWIMAQNHVELPGDPP
jgi:Double-GTPase 2